MSQITTATTGGGGGGDVNTLTGNNGGAVGATAGNINVVGDGFSTVVNGSPGSSTLTITTVNALQQLSGDTGFANPSDGGIRIAGGTLIDTVASGSTVSVSLEQGLDGQVPIASTGNPTQYANITSPMGTITITNGPNTIGIDTASAASGVKITTFTSTGTFFIDPETKWVTTIIFNAGCGGGSGRRGVTELSSGGGGGASGAVAYYSTAAVAFSSSESVIVGSAGTGGSSQTSNNTNGVGGGAGGFSSLGNLTTYRPDAHLSDIVGRGGTSVSGAAGQYITVLSSHGIGTSISQLDGGATLTAGGGTVGLGGYGGDVLQYSMFSGTGGGGGGGGSSTTSSVGGGDGGIMFTTDGFSGLVSGGSAGSTSSPAGGAGISTLNSAIGGAYFGGTGGGGGAGQSTLVPSLPGNGGSGAFPGGGGGGGGGSLNGTNSGAGGNGGDGAVVVIEFM